MSTRNLVPSQARMSVRPVAGAGRRVAVALLAIAASAFWYKTPLVQRPGCRAKAPALTPTSVSLHPSPETSGPQRTRTQ
jgi:hypothetical protein